MSGSFYITSPDALPSPKGTPYTQVYKMGEWIGKYNAHGIFVAASTYLDPATKDFRPDIKEASVTQHSTQAQAQAPKLTRKKDPRPMSGVQIPESMSGFSDGWISNNTPVYFRVLAANVEEYTNGQLWCKSCESYACHHISNVLKNHLDAIDAASPNQSSPYTRCSELIIPIHPGIWDSCIGWVRDGRLWVSLWSLEDNWPDEIVNQLGGLTAVRTIELLKEAGEYIEMIEPTEGRFIMRQLIVSHLSEKFATRGACKAQWHSAPNWGHGTFNQANPRAPEIMRDTLSLLQTGCCWECVSDSLSPEPDRPF